MKKNGSHDETREDDVQLGLWLERTNYLPGGWMYKNRIPCNYDEEAIPTEMIGLSQLRRVLKPYGPLEDL